MNLRDLEVENFAREIKPINYCSDINIQYTASNDFRGSEKSKRINREFTSKHSTELKSQKVQATKQSCF